MAAFAFFNQVFMPARKGPFSGGRAQRHPAGRGRCMAVKNNKKQSADSNLKEKVGGKTRFAPLATSSPMRY